MSRALLPILFFALGLGCRQPSRAASGAPATSPAQRGGLSGAVADATTGARVSGAWVLLTGAEAGAAPRRIGVQTDAEGRFEFLGLPLGRYLLRTTLAGYRREEREVAIRRVASDTVTVRLESWAPRDSVARTERRRALLVPTATTPCRPPDEESAYATRLIASMLDDAEPMAATTRRALRLPRARASEIRLVTEPSLCRRAVSALASPAEAPARTQLYLFTLGRAGFATLDPLDLTYGTDCYTIAFFDRKFAPLGAAC